MIGLRRSKAESRTTNSRIFAEVAGEMMKVKRAPPSRRGGDLRKISGEDAHFFLLLVRLASSGAGSSVSGLRLFFVVRGGIGRQLGRDSGVHLEDISAEEKVTAVARWRAGFE